MTLPSLRLLHFVPKVMKPMELFLGADSPFPHAVNPDAEFVAPSLTGFGGRRAGFPRRHFNRL